MRIRSAFVALCVLATLTVTPNAHGFDLPGVLTGYSLTSWVERDGIQIGPIRALVQDEDGYLWLGTDTGLLRFDGIRFVTTESLGYSGFPSSPIRSLSIAHSDRSLWIGFAEGGGIRVVRDGRLDPIGSGLSSLSVSSIAEDRDGTVWAATDRGLFSYRHAAWSSVPVSDGAQQPTTLGVHVSQGGTLMVGTSSGLFERTDDGRFVHVGASHASVRDVETDGNGQLWVTDPIDGFRAVRADRTTHHDHEGIGTRIFRDRRANVWIGTRGQGLWRIRPGVDDTRATVETATVDTGLVSNGIWDVLEDREGNLWIATQHGLSRLTPHSVTPIGDLGLVHSVEAGADGSVWVGTASGLIRLDGKSPGGTASRSLSTSEVRALYRDDAGTLWFGGEERIGRVSGGTLAPLPGATPNQLKGIRSITGDGAKGLWLVVESGTLFHWDANRLAAFELPTHDKVKFAYHDGQSRVWLALQQGRLGTIDSDRRVHLFTAADGFADGTQPTINAIAQDKNGTMWIGGSGGLTRFRDGRFTTITREQGLPAQRVAAVIADDFGYLWLGADGGLVRFRPAEFDAALTQTGYKISHSQFDQQDGLAGVTLPTNNEGALRTPDGRLWFVTGRGLTLVDPTTIDEGKGEITSLARVEGALADEKRFNATPGVTLPANITRLRIDYTALQLTAPTKARFRYRLDGFDPQWIDAGTRRQAYYMNLGPRTYRFVVQTANKDGRWIDADASWDFAIQPLFYQTRWFQGLSIVAFVLCLWGAWQLRFHRVRQQFAMILAERARLSREIHDTVLQNLAGVAIQCAGISNALEPNSPVRRQVDAVRSELEDHLREARQAVWNLRAPILETDDLAEALRTIAGRLTRETPVRFDLTVRGETYQCPPQVENEILRIGQEAVTNAVRHARASHVQIELRFEGRSLTLKVSDNGSGFHAEITNGPEGHFGLIGMRERAAHLGGTLKIGRPTTGGTEVELIVPAALRAAEG